MAVTDHGNIHSIVDFYTACKEEGIKPVIGIEFYIADNMNKKEKGDKRYHLIALAKNNEGLKNLNKLSSASYIDGFYYKPRIDFELLKQHSEGLIITSACLGGQISQALLNDDYDKAKKIAEDYKSVFGEDFYLEIEANKYEDQFKINEELVKLSKDTDIELVAAVDIHYLNKEDADPHDFMLAVQTGSQLDNPDRFKFDNDELYYKSDDEVRRDLFNKPGYEEEIEQAIANTYKIADKCNVELELGNPQFPNFDVPKGYSLDEWLVQSCYDELYKMADEEGINLEKYAKQLDHELRIITSKGFSGYFLIVSDFIRWAKNQGIAVGPARGSAGGSIVSYLLDIIEINPVENRLFFSRFLNEERESLPDIDIDISNERRQEVINYIGEKYGEDHVAHIGTFGTMATKGALKDAGRALGYPFDEMNRMSKLIGFGAKSLEDEIEKSEELKKEAEKHKELFKYAKSLEGKPRQAGTHACAMVITPKPVVDYVPLMVNNGEVVTQTEKDNTEELGLLKMDFLGLRTLDILRETIDRAKINNPDSNLPDVNGIWKYVDYEDKKVFKEIFQKGDTNGVFQCESDGFKKMLKKMKPTKFDHIVASLALYRPGPLEGGVVDTYINRLNGKEEVEYLHEDLEPILKPTFGIILYQEQIIEITKEIAGYTAGAADMFRRAIGKKKKNVMEAEKAKFIQGCLDNEYSEELAEELFELIEYFSGYGFNKSHSAAYAMVSFSTAYLKYYYPAEFYAAIMTVETEKTPKDSSLDEYISDCYKREIKILPPDINESGYRFTAINENEIRLGLSTIKGLGDKALEQIIEKRPFEDLADLYRRIDRRSLNNKGMKNLIKAGALDFCNKNRNKLLDDQKELIKGKGVLNGRLFETPIAEPNRKAIIKMELEAMDFTVTYPSPWMYAKEKDKAIIEGKVTDLFKTRTKHGDMMAFVTLETDAQDIETIFFPDVFGQVHHCLKKGNNFRVAGKKSGNKLIVNKAKEIMGLSDTQVKIIS